jgi:hypothetical protein
MHKPQPRPHLPSLRAHAQWDRMAASLNGGVAPDTGSSFFVGDAAGRPTDFENKVSGSAKANQPLYDFNKES